MLVSALSWRAQHLLYGTDLFDHKHVCPQKNGKNVKSYIEIQYPDFKPIPIEHLGQLPHPQPSKKPEREYRDEGNHEKDNESHGRCHECPAKRAIGTKSSTVLLTNSSTLSAG